MLKDNIVARGLPQRSKRKTFILYGVPALLVATFTGLRISEAAEPAATFADAQSSQPLAITSNGSFLGAVNPDNNTVSFFDLRGDFNQRIAQVPVQKEPNGIVILPNNLKAYVANTVSGTVSVMTLNLAGGVVNPPFKNIKVGTEPYGLVLTPNGTKLYVSNARSNSISVIDTVSDTVVKTILDVGVEPRGLAVTNDGDANDLDETLFVTQFLSPPKPGRIDGEDDAKQAFVTVLSTATDKVTKEITLNPIPDTGFKAEGDAIARIAPTGQFTFITGAYPNQLNNIAIRGKFAYIPSTGASPNGPVRFDVNTQSLLSYININQKVEAAPSFNMHTAVRDQTNSKKLFITQPWAMAFKHNSNVGYVVSAASNIMVKILVDAASGLPSVQSDPADLTRVLEIPTGKNPRGVVVNRTDSRAYVMNYVSRDITAIDLLHSPERVLSTMVSASLPTPGTLADTMQVGKELYNTSVGVFDPATPGGTPITGRMSQAGWGSCASCHPNGLSDNVVWIFPSGPKRTISQHTDFDQTDPTRSIIRALNWSAERDEEEDFELNIRAVSGGLGLIVAADGVSQEPNVANFLPLANGGRNQLKVHGVNAWDAIKAYVQSGIRAPISALSKANPDVVAGQQLFKSANCQLCHGGAQWTSSRVRFTPPPPADQVVNTELINELRQVGTFDSSALNEVRATGTPPLGADGFAPASLLSAFMFSGSHLHNGAANTLDQVLENVEHRSAGTGVDTLSGANQRKQVVKFILSIDAKTTPIPIP